MTTIQLLVQRKTVEYDSGCQTQLLSLHGSVHPELSGQLAQDTNSAPGSRAPIITEGALWKEKTFQRWGIPGLDIEAYPDVVLHASLDTHSEETSGQAVGHAAALVHRSCNLAGQDTRHPRRQATCKKEAY
jgi:hypothetical protein